MFNIVTDLIEATKVAVSRKPNTVVPFHKSKRKCTTIDYGLLSGLFLGGRFELVAFSTIQPMEKAALSADVQRART